jgi:hypothetical protein
MLTPWIFLPQTKAGQDGGDVAANLTVRPFGHSNLGITEIHDYAEL